MYWSNRFPVFFVCANAKWGYFYIYSYVDLQDDKVSGKINFI